MRARAVRSRAGWTRESPPGDKLAAFWRHDASGWVVRHCGHPTAIWPYYAVDPTDHEDRCVVTHNGLGLPSLYAALIAVELVLAGELVTTDARCGATTRRILGRWDEDRGPWCRESE